MEAGGSLMQPRGTGAGRHALGCGFFAALLLTATGCGTSVERPDAADSSAAKPESLQVAAASDLRDALPVLARRFTETTSVTVVPTFGASGQLAEQIKAGAPFDVFLAANLKFVADLAAAEFIRPASVVPYAQGTLVLAVYPESGGAIAALADLKKPEVKKIALANPAFAPYGAAGKQALERAGLWDEVAPRIVQAESVRQALQFVETGNAEAGLVGKALTGGAGVRVVAIDPALYDPIIQGMGIVTQTRSRSAEEFSAFVLGPEGQKILADFGFKAPPAPR
jgi:molybdate transport system substrate-binding protein